MHAGRAARQSTVDVVVDESGLPAPPLVVVAATVDVVTLVGSGVLAATMQPPSSSHADQLLFASLQAVPSGS